MMTVTNDTITAPLTLREVKIFKKVIAKSLIDDEVKANPHDYVNLMALSGKLEAYEILINDKSKRICGVNKISAD